MEQRVMDNVNKTNADLIKRLRGPVRQAAQDLINAAFNNREGRGVQFSIPAKPDEDTDLVLVAGIKAAADALEAAERERDELLFGDKHIAELVREHVALKAKLEAAERVIAPWAKGAVGYTEQDVAAHRMVPVHVSWLLAARDYLARHATGRKGGDDASNDEWAEKRAEQLLDELGVENGHRHRRSVSAATALRDAIEHGKAEQDKAVAAERVHSRWNVEPQPNGDLYVCRGEHDKVDACYYERFVPGSAIEEWRARAEAAEAKLVEQDKAQIALRVGDELFVFGSAESTQVCQDKLYRMEAAEAKLARLADPDEALVRLAMETHHHAPRRRDMGFGAMKEAIRALARTLTEVQEENQPSPKNNT